MFALGPNEWLTNGVQRFRENSSSVINLRANDEITFCGAVACDVLKLNISVELWRGILRNVCQAHDRRAGSLGY